MYSFRNWTSIVSGTSRLPQHKWLARANGLEIAPVIATHNTSTQEGDVIAI